ncbi:FAD/NAD(P)-binding domain-containing protein [Nocardia sp. NRRL S-836]|uniref:FAD/NAD(P)-binding protein n=1 Tax=Nocardia sp. NRRL S-836 TaxID=1519492 RepID=UPI0006AEB617|nr:FAD/NAD(P)-binding domain-containing protein [Nocardia sp. NRRL S-836]KOV79257.1 adenylate cyclase [Nocardia sp. NRRL S-836]
MRSLVVIGGGPRAAGLLERIAAHAPALELVVHVVDPFPAGAGRVWRHAQSPLLRMNSMAEDVTVFTDASFTGLGPVREGPSLAQWGDVDPTSFPSRQVQSGYLEWFFRHAVASLPSNVTVREHRARAVRVTGRTVDLDDGSSLSADVLVLALGHLDAEPEPEHRKLAEHASAHGLVYVPPLYSADADLSEVTGDVLLRGFGLAFIDLMVLLTEGRGGRFTGSGADLRYVPSGAEPRLFVGSRRGVPYHSKTGYRLQGERPVLPRFFTAAALEGRSWDFRTDVWPLIAKEVAWGHYHELGTGHPDRLRLPFAQFAAAFAALPWYSREMRELEARAVPDPADRIDFERLDRPLAGVTFETGEELQEHLRSYIAADVARRSDPRHSADLGAFLALLSVYGQLPDVRLRDADPWWHGYFSYLASGPPPDRLEELLALSRAGIVRFVGADMWVEAVDGAFLAGSATTPEVVRANGLVEARLPGHTLSRTADPVLKSLRANGAVSEDGDGFVRVTAEGRLIGEDGAVDPARFAVGPYAAGRTFAAFARPNTNAPAFRQNDVIARTVLRQLGD